MQIGDYLGQYTNTLNQAASSQQAQATAGQAAEQTQSLTTTLSQLQEGTVFEGSINSVQGTKITLGLSNGQMISARLDASIQLLQGQSFFFQVKSNDGQTIAIKPYADPRSFNPTIQKALDAAGIAMNRDSIDMVNRMMQEGMPIDRGSLSSMHHTLLQNPQVSMETAVLMTRLGIPVNAQTASQFENYQNDRHAMLTQTEQVMDELPKMFQSGEKSVKELLQLNQHMIEILDDGQAAEGRALFVEKDAQGEMPPATLQGRGDPKQESLQPLQAMPQGQEERPQGVRPLEQNALPSPEGSGQGKASTGFGGVEEQAKGHVLAKPLAEQGADAAKGKEGTQASRPTASMLLGKQGMAQLEAQIKAVFPEQNGKINGNMNAKELLDALAQQLRQHTPEHREALAKLFSGKEYHALMREAMEEQWTVRPEGLKSEHKVEELYDRLSRQMGQIEQLAKQAGMDAAPLSQAASDVRSNIDFMNQLNQMYTYVQIPLKMANQNAHSDLYVYTNKRKLQNKEGELSAFLHLDLDNLGSTDVSIKMVDKNVTTKFFLADDASYDLVEEHLPQLEARLAALGYHCRITLENRDEPIDFVEDFLQKSQPAKGNAARGMVHRYSFDVRA